MSEIATFSYSRRIRFENNLGIQIDYKLTFEYQINKAFEKENNMVRILKRTFVSRDTKTWNKLYKT